MKTNISHQPVTLLLIQLVVFSVWRENNVHSFLNCCAITTSCNLQTFQYRPTTSTPTTPTTTTTTTTTYICSSSSRTPHNFDTRNKSKNNDDDDEEGGHDFDNVVQDFSVTDEEALLACRAYLQRKNVLGWTQSKRRKKQAKNSLALASITPSDTITTAATTRGSTSADSEGAIGSRNLNVGYFWEDPNELQYLKTGRPRRIIQGDDFEEDEVVVADGDMANYDDDIDDEYGNHADGVYDEENIDVGMRTSEDTGIFTSFPAFPPQTHELQSKARKKLFNDPEWKKNWYQQRWGDPQVTEKRRRNKRQKEVEKLIQKIPSSILRSNELATLSDEEIEDAIQTYMVSNRKRRNAHLKFSKEKDERLMENNPSFQKKSQDEDDDDTNNNQERSHLSFIPSADDMKEIQKKRSMTAAKAYETRIQNKKMKQSYSGEEVIQRIKEKKNLLKHITFEGGLSPRQAMERIEEMINDGKYPLSTDIDAILVPNRLSGRKDLLRNVLKHTFQCTGKCIPDLSKVEMRPDEFYLTGDVDNIKKKFITQSTIIELGLFINYLTT